MFDWAHVLHRQVYDVLADERLPVEREGCAKSRGCSRTTRRGRMWPSAAAPKDMDLMEEQPYSLAFRRSVPEVQRVDLGVPLAAGRAVRAAHRGQDSARTDRPACMRRRAFPRRCSSNRRAHAEAVMPMTAAVAPEFAARYPEVAIIFDNLHSMHDVISDVLADTTIPRLAQARPDPARRAALSRRHDVGDDGRGVARDGGVNGRRPDGRSGRHAPRNAATSLTRRGRWRSMSMPA